MENVFRTEGILSQIYNNLEQLADKYADTGKSYHNPRYYNIGGLDKSGRLEIKSTQNYRYSFHIDNFTDLTDIDMIFVEDNLWAKFKEVRNEYLNNNYSHIDTKD